MKGALGEGVMPSLLRTLYVERRVGTLDLMRSEERAPVRTIRDRQGKLATRWNIFGGLPHASRQHVQSDFLTLAEWTHWG